MYRVDLLQTAKVLPFREDGSTMALARFRPKIILASRSPRRRELLIEAGYPLEVVPPDEAAESGQLPGESPEQLVARLAYQKTIDVGARIENGLIVGCDTVVECDGEVLGKPADDDHARRMLRTLCGRKHRVLSGLCVFKKPGGMPRLRVAVTILAMDHLSDAQIEEYVANGGWEGKAGGFGYQDRLGWVHVIQGSESNVVGLPLETLDEMIAECG
jgi:septum formation protein